MDCAPCTGNKQVLLSAFVDSEGAAINKSTSPVTILLDEESVLSRLDVIKGFGTVEQEQHVYLVTKNPLNLYHRKRLHFHGSNRGSTLAMVVLPDWKEDSVWREKVDVKKSSARLQRSQWVGRQPENPATKRGTRYAQTVDGQTDGRTEGQPNGRVGGWVDRTDNNNTVY